MVEAPAPLRAPPFAPALAPVVVDLEPSGADVEVWAFEAAPAEAAGARERAAVFDAGFEVAAGLRARLRFGGLTLEIMC